MNFYAEFGGGLGDVFQQLFLQGHYAGLKYLEPGDTVDVVIVSHNPYVGELFEWHPLRSQMNILKFPYIDREDYHKKRQEYGLPPYHKGGGRILSCTAPEEVPRLYPSPTDISRLQDLFQRVHHRDIVVIAGGAGLPDRNLPEPMLLKLIAEVLERGFVPVLVGRTYDRHGRFEPFFADRPEGCLDYIDELSVPGTAALVNHCAGIICGHSALNMFAWHVRRPQLLLYPESVEKEHIIPRSWWAPGIDYSECFHGRFDQIDVVTDRIAGFFEWIVQQRTANA